MKPGRDGFRRVRPGFIKRLKRRKLLFGKLETKEWVEKWLKVTVRVFMKDL